MTDIRSSEPKCLSYFDEKRKYRAASVVGALALILTYSDAQKLSSMEEIVEDVEVALKALGEGRALIPNTRINHPFGEGLASAFAVAAVFPERNLMAMKTAFFNWENPSKRRMPHLYGVLILCDAVTGLPLALMDSMFISYARTGGIAGVGAKYLARKDSRVVGILGSRDLARYSLMGIKEVLPDVQKALVYSKTDRNRKLFVEEMRPILKMDIEAVSSADEAVKPADIVIGASNANEPIIIERSVKPGTYIAGMGNKNEVEPSLLKKAKVIPETIAECKIHGKIGVAFKEQIITEEEIYGELAEVISGKKAGRMSNDEIILIDSIGLAIEDLLVADRVYQKAKRLNVGTWIDMWKDLRVW